MRRHSWRDAIFTGLIFLLVIAFFVWMGATTMQTGKPPVFGPQWYIGGSIWIIIITSFRLGKSDWRSFSLPQIALLIGFTLFNCAHFIPPGVLIKPWLDNGGTVLMLLGLFRQLFGSHTPTTDATDADGAGETE
jgi:hypothetical protein